MSILFLEDKKNTATIGETINEYDINDFMEVNVRKQKMRNFFFMDFKLLWNQVEQNIGLVVELENA